MNENGKNSSGRSAEEELLADLDRHEAGGDFDDMSELADALGEHLETDDESLDEETEFDPVAELEAENSTLKDRVLRAAAEMENLRRRTEREKAEATSTLR